MNVCTPTLRTRCFLAGLLVVVVSSASGPALAVQKTREARVPNLYEARQQVDEYISSGRYDRDVAKVVASARVWLERRAGKALKPAIVLDIDETSLSTWPALRINGWMRVTDGPCDLQKAPCGSRAFQAMALAKAIAPTLVLARRARELGVAVFFITGRPARLREATERNLREQGFQWAAVILKPDDLNVATVVDFKAPERRKIAEQGYTIILNLGDQESDLKGGYAERTFKLPNPVYLVR